MISVTLICSCYFNSIVLQYPIFVCLESIDTVFLECSLQLQPRQAFEIPSAEKMGLQSENIFTLELNGLNFQLDTELEPLLDQETLQPEARA